MNFTRSMIGAVRERLSYANVMATLALFVALGGMGYAAVKLDSNSVGSRELRNKAVGLKELSPKVRGELIKGTAEVGGEPNGGPFANDDNPCAFVDSSSPCQNVAGEEHRPVPNIGHDYTLSCSSPAVVAEVTGKGGGQFPVWTVVTNAKNVEAVATFSEPAPPPESGYVSITYNFTYYAFDRDHVQGFVACVVPPVH